jgi:hypothetical protein
MPNQLKLFKVVSHSVTSYFQNKMAAKKLCDAGSANGGKLYVMRGPDHWRGESFNNTKRTRGARSTW